MTKEEEHYHKVASILGEAEKSQMFGKPCYKINKKAFCSFFQNEMVFKLQGEAHRDALSYDGAQLFDPSGKGRAMKEWVQLPGDYMDKWDQLAQEAYTYVRG